MIQFMDIFAAFQLSILGYIVTAVLMDGENILSRYDDLLIDMENYNAKFKILTNPLGRCTKCFTGQIAFWRYTLSNESYCRVDYVTAFLEVATYTAFAILFAMILLKIFKVWSLKK